MFIYLGALRGRMAKSFKFLPDIAIADVAFDAVGGSLDEVFEACAEALCEVMAKRSSVGSGKEKVIALSAGTEEQLLFDFLSEVVFVKDAEGVVFSQVSVKVTEGKKCSLKAVLKGESIDPERQELGNDVKAVTLHLFSLKKAGSGYKARVVLDI